LRASADNRDRMQLPERLRAVEACRPIDLGGEPNAFGEVVGASAAGR
jgi:hypothetical protein